MIYLCVCVSSLIMNFRLNVGTVRQYIMLPYIIPLGSLSLLIKQGLDGKNVPILLSP
jgi:hypothetical protein